LSDTAIVRVAARRVLASDGRPAIEVEIGLACGVSGRASVPVDDAGGDAAAARVNAIIAYAAPALEGVRVGRREDVDATLFKLNVPHRRLSRDALAACSLAALQAAAAAREQPLFRSLARQDPARMPLPVVELLAEAWPLAPIHSISIVPYSAESLEEALALAAAVHQRAGDLLVAHASARGLSPLGGHAASFSSGDDAIELAVRAIEAAGYVPGYDVGITVDVAAARLHRDGLYRAGAAGHDRDRWCEMLAGWTDRHPLSALQDPFAPCDAAGLRELRRATRSGIRLVGGESLASDAGRIGVAIADGALSGVVLHLPTAGTVSELRAAVDLAAAAGWEVTLASRSGDTDDAALVHLATAWELDYLQCGAAVRGECAVRWNEALRIEAVLGALPLGARIERAARMVH
jgi:enolase